MSASPTYKSILSPTCESILVSFVGGPLCGCYERIYALSTGQYPCDIMVRDHDRERSLYAIDPKQRIAIYWGTLEDFTRPTKNVRRQEPSSKDPHQDGQSKQQGKTRPKTSRRTGSP